MTENTNYRQQLLERLKQLGLQPKWVKQVVWPEWWSKELDGVASARYELESILARQLNLSLSSLRSPQSELQLLEAPRARFKQHKGVDLAKVKLARAIGARLGALVAEVSRKSKGEATDWSQWSALKIREAILSGGAPWVGLEQLLEFCWGHDLPVVHASLPVGMGKFDGMALCPANNPVILTFCNRKSPAWQAFVVAHELGHHVLGHIGKGGEIFDSRVREQDEQDEEEAAANLFAVELLTGTEETHVTYRGRWPEAAVMAQQAQEFGGQRQVLPGTLLLNLCFHKPLLRPLAMRALGILEEGQDALALYATHASAADWLELSDDDYSFASRLATLPGEVAAA